MKHLPARCLFAALSSFAAWLPAQIHASVALAGDYQVAVTLTGSTTVASQPAGFAPTTVTLQTGQQPNAAAGFGWNVLDQGPFGLSFTAFLNLALLVPNASAQKPVSDLVLTLTAPGATPVRVQPTRQQNLTGAGQLPQWDVDLGDDGVPDYTAAMPTLAPVSLVLGPQPTRIRLHNAASLQQTGVVQFLLRLDVVPDNGVAVTGITSGCSQSEMYLGSALAGTGGDVAWMGLLAEEPQWAVLGLSTAWLPLPLTLSAAPNCVLAVSPDVVFPIFPFSYTAMPIPAALRPVTLWTQNVTLQANGFAVGGLAQIDAQ